jgi:transposase-like protein
MFKGRDFDQSAIPLSVRWYLAYNLSPPDLEEMMIERGLSVDQSTVHCWVVQFSPALERFNRRKRAVTGKWQVTSGKWQVDDPKGSAEQQDLHQGSRPMDVHLSRHLQRRPHGSVLLR